MDFATIQGFTGGGQVNNNQGLGALSSVIQGFTGGSQSTSSQGSNSLGSTIGGVGGAALGTVLLPGIGTALGSSIGSMIGGLFGGNGPKPATGVFAGLHSPVLEPLDENQWWEGDASKVASWAKQLGISVEEVAILLAFDSSSSGNAAQYVWDAYASNGDGSAGANAIEGLIKGFNSGNVGARITRGQMGPSNVSNASFPAIANYKGGARMVTLRARISEAPSYTPIQTMASAPPPTNSALLGQLNQLAYQNLLGGQTSTAGFVLPSTATPPYLATNTPAASNTPAATPKNNTTTYALIGGGVLLVLLVVFLLLKKK
jgi:hypothetical protein